jgi:hypothetical protein
MEYLKHRTAVVTGLNSNRWHRIRGQDDIEGVEGCETQTVLAMRDAFSASKRNEVACMSELLPIANFQSIKRSRPSFYPRMLSATKKAIAGDS